MSQRDLAAVKRNRRIYGLSAVAAAVACLGLTQHSHAQTTIFNDNFSNGSTINNGPNNNTSALTVTSTSTNYDIASTKTTAGSTIAAGSLSVTLGSTTSGVVEAQALFTNSPVVLQNVGDQIQLQVVFTDAAGLLAAGNSSELYFGLYNSSFDGSQVQPLSGLMSAGLSTSLTNDTNGGVANWQGYNARVAPNTGTGNVYMRQQQGVNSQNGTGTNNQNQDLVGDDAGGGLYDQPAGPTFGSGSSTVALTVGAQYTDDLDITLSGTNTLSIAENLYQGVGSGGTNLFSLNAAVTSSFYYNNTFDGLAFGYRESATTLTETPQNMSVNQITVTQTSAPIFMGWLGTDATSPGSWSVADNWTNNQIPNSVGATANFANSNSTAVTLDGNETVGSLLFANATAYTLSSGTTNTTSTLIMDNGGTAATALISATLGAGHVISAPIVLNSNVVLNSVGGTSLTIDGNISSGTLGATGVTITGGGFISLQGSDTYTGSTTVASGAQLKVQGAAAIPTGSAVVNNGALSLQYGNILDTAVQGPVVLGSVSGTGTIAIGSNKNAYVQLAAGSGGIQQGDLTMMLTNGTSGVEALLDLNGVNATVGGLATGTAGLNVIGNSSLLSGSTLTFAPASTTATSTFAGTLQDGVNGSGSQLALQVASGTLILTSSNTYTGNTTIGSGALLQVGNGVSGYIAGGNIIDNGTIAFLNGGVGPGYVVSNNISGSGGFLQNTAFTVILAGSNTYTGTTAITLNGSLIAGAVGALSPHSAILDGSLLDIEANNTSGNISGTGALVIGQNTPSVLKLSPSATYPSAGSTIGSLTISSGSSLDLTNNPLTVNYAASGIADPVSTIVSYLTDGFNSGWAGGEINSSMVAALNHSQSALIYSVGYADGADGITGVSSGEVEILPTLAGDAKMQGNVVFGDFQLLSQYFGQSGTSWDEGDFTYNGTTNFGDFQLLSQNFGASAGTGLTAGELASLNSFAAQFGDGMVANPDGVGFSLVSVPEPASAGLLALAGLASLKRRRRKTS
jgi:fibronectin-binding autotransporter adhesin